jgi:hypothetical protein
MKLSDCKNPKKQGDVGLGAAIAWFTCNGYTVCLPLTDSQEYDLVVDNGTLKRVQVKTTRNRSKYGVFEVELRTKGGNKSGTTTKMFDGSKVDLLFVLTDDGDQYLFPTDILGVRNRLSLGKEYEGMKL